MVLYTFKNNDISVTVGKIICLARNYAKHAQEMDSKISKEPLVFLKPESAVILNKQSIIIPKMSQCVHHEVELGVVIGKEGKNIHKNKAKDHILGYLVGLDITARDIQSQAKQHGWPWSIAKGFDTFAPISDVVIKEEISDPNNLDIMLKVNGEVKQYSNTKYMIYSVEEIIEFISKIMTLKKGDLILTGTPEGVDEIKAGDVLDAQLGNFCFLHIDVKKA